MTDNWINNQCFTYSNSVNKQTNQWRIYCHECYDIYFMNVINVMNVIQSF